MQLSLSLKFIIGCSLTLLAALGMTFYVLNERQERFILEQAENKARAVFQQLVLTRAWIADHGGIFVRDVPGQDSGYFAEDLQIRDQEGGAYGLKTPAMVTKELAEQARDEGEYWFNITSTKLMNPENAPDELEKQAIQTFRNTNQKELIQTETIDEEPHMRYIAPLYTQEACLHCHGHQGFQVGDVHGAISVTLPLEETMNQAAQNRRTMLTAMILVTVALSAAMILMMRYLVLRPVQDLSQSIKQFSEGSYDPSQLRRTGDELEELSHTFADMASRLTEYHHDLKNKIHEATQDLENTNHKLIQANEQLSEINRKKSDFIARASHELRTPLTSIKGSMEYITTRINSISQKSDDTRECSQLLDFCDLVRNNTDRLIRMVSTMLDLERIENDAETQLSWNHFDLAELIEETVQEFSLGTSKNVHFKVKTPETLPILADQDRIQQVLVNLLSNALKFTPNNSTVLIQAFEEQDQVRVEVTDEGPGIPLSERERVFDKLIKLGGKEGSGLGLSICRSVIQAHKGKVWAEEAEAGQGARIVFRLPRGLSVSSDL